MSGKNVFASNSDIYVKSNNTEVKVIGSTGNVFVNTVPLGYVETVDWSSNGLSPSTATNYGITYISMTGTDPSSSPRVLSLAPPVPGIEKVIILDSTAPYVNTVDVDFGAGVGVGGSTTNRFLAFSTLATQEQSVTLIGISTSLWGLMTVNSTVGAHGNDLGIRSLTAARTS
jgi:hypothetical protein